MLTDEERQRIHQEARYFSPAGWGHVDGGLTPEAVVAQMRGAQVRPNEWGYLFPATLADEVILWAAVDDMMGATGFLEPGTAAGRTVYLRTMVREGPAFLQRLACQQEDGHGHGDTDRR